MNILAFAYACEPGEGSEPGAGWMWARLLARLGDTYVITRSNNQGAIEANLHTVPERHRLHFVYVDLPPWSRRWKRGRRGIHLYYVLWQMAGLRAARRLMADRRFDLTWHVTLTQVWIGSVAGLLDIPFVFGPIGGGTRPPLRLLGTLGAKGIAYEATRATARGLGRYLNPLARSSWRRATLILTQNADTQDWFPRRHRHKAHVFPNVVMDTVPAPGVRRADGPARPTALFAGSLVPLKGVALGIQAISLLPGWELLVYGSGSDEQRLRATARRFGVAERVRFMGEVPRELLLKVMSEDADVCLFPSFHDEAGWVVVEALSSGLPVVCLDRGGPPALGGTAISPSTPARTSKALADAMEAVRAAPVPAQSRWDLDARFENLASLLAAHGLLPAPVPR